MPPNQTARFRSETDGDSSELDEQELDVPEQERPPPWYRENDPVGSQPVRMAQRYLEVPQPQ